MSTAPTLPDVRRGPQPVSSDRPNLRSTSSSGVKDSPTTVAGGGGTGNAGGGGGGGGGSRMAPPRSLSTSSVSVSTTTASSTAASPLPWPPQIAAEDPEKLADNATYVFQSHNDVTTAVRMFRRALVKRPRSERILSAYAHVLLASGRDVDGADKLFSDALNVNPSYVPALHGAAAAKLRQGQAVVADVLCDRALRLDPDDVTTLAVAASVARELSQHARAASVLRTALLHNPRDEDLHCALTAALEADVAPSVTVVAAFNAAITRLPDNCRLHAEFARYLLRAGVDDPSPEVMFRRALELSPRDAAVTADLAALLTTRPRQAAEATALFERAAALDPHNPRVLLECAKHLQAHNHHDRADAMFTRALSAAPFDAVVLACYGDFMRLVRQDLPMAEELYRQAAAADPSNPQLPMKLKLCHPAPMGPRVAPTDLSAMATPPGGATSPPSAARLLTDSPVLSVSAPAGSTVFGRNAAGWPVTAAAAPASSPSPSPPQHRPTSASRRHLQQARSAAALLDAPLCRQARDPWWQVPFGRGSATMALPSHVPGGMLGAIQAGLFQDGGFAPRRGPSFGLSPPRGALPPHLDVLRPHTAASGLPTSLLTTASVSDVPSRPPARTPPARPKRAPATTTAATPSLHPPDVRGSPVVGSRAVAEAGTVFTPPRLTTALAPAGRPRRASDPGTPGTPGTPTPDFILDFHSDLHMVASGGSPAAAPPSAAAAPGSGPLFGRRARVPPRGHPPPSVTTAVAAAAAANPTPSVSPIVAAHRASKSPSPSPLSGGASPSPSTTAAPAVPATVAAVVASSSPVVAVAAAPAPSPSAVAAGDAHITTPRPSRRPAPPSGPPPAAAVQAGQAIARRTARRRRQQLASRSSSSSTASMPSPSAVARTRGS